jgi:uncharacterized protein YbjT (DUF2867 family)
MSSQKFLIIGASGGVGGSLLRQLLALPSPLPIRVSSRDPSKNTFPQGVEVVKADLEDPTSYPALFKSITKLFLYANKSTPLPELLSAAESTGIKHIVLLSSMTVEFKPEGMIGAMHRKIEEAIVESGINYTFLRPRNFASNAKQFWAPTIKKTGKLWITYPNATSAPVSEVDIAAIALVALTSDKLTNQAIGLSGTMNITQKEQIDAISRVREREGKKVVELVVLEPEQWKEKMGEYGMPEDFREQLLAWWKASDGNGEMIQTSERVTGVKSLNFEEWLAVNKEAFL